jgi:hypothetical protein
MSKETKLDLHKKYQSEYVMPKQPVFVVVGPAKYLAIEGRGAPGGTHFKEHVAALYAVAYTLKMAEKMAGQDYKVCHLEGQWWAADGADFRTHRPEDWAWKLLIRIPEFVTEQELHNAITAVLAKGKSPLAGQVKLEVLAEGRCVQMLHIGPYAQEKTTVEMMHHMAEDNGLHLRGPHHEIYLSDPNRVPPERLRTIVRYPVE